jgi:hypothetical protein
LYNLLGGPVRQSSEDSPSRSKAPPLSKHSSSRRLSRGTFSNGEVVLQRDSDRKGGKSEEDIEYIGEERGDPANNPIGSIIRISCKDGDTMIVFNTHVCYDERNRHSLKAIVANLVVQGVGFGWLSRYVRSTFCLPESVRGL